MSAWSLWYLQPGPRLLSVLPCRRLWHLLDSGRTAHTSCPPPSSGGTWALLWCTPDPSSGDSPGSPVNPANAQTPTLKEPPAPRADDRVRFTCLSRRRSPRMRNCELPEVGTGASSGGSRRHTPTRLRAPPSWANQPPLESSRVITTAFTRTM